MTYAVIIPSKNEEQDLPLVLESLVKQSLKPNVVLIVDDNSDDRTKDVALMYEKKYPFIKYLFRDGDHAYSLGGKVVEVFNFGLDFLDRNKYDYDYVIKMDADITFNSDLFFELEKRLLGDDNLGIASCSPFVLDNNRKIFRNSPTWHTNGDFKIYNKKCLADIDGLRKDIGWDCADNICAMEKGWNTKVFRELWYEQKRPMGRFSVVKGFIREGIGAYKLRYSIFYMLAKVFHDAFKKPYLIIGIYYFQGYFRARKKYPARTLTKSQSKLLRKLLWKSFFVRFKEKDFILLQRFSGQNAISKAS